MQELGNIFEKGCLVQLSISVWGGSAKINEEIAKEALGSEWAKARKLLVDREALKPVEKIRNSARQYLREKSLPFPIDGVMFIPFESVEKVDEKLKDLAWDFSLAVDSFQAGYENAVEVAKTVLGSLFDENDYPQEIRRKFNFNWRFFLMEAPGKNSLLSPELVAREQEKFLETMKEARELAVEALRVEFGQLVKNACEKLAPAKEGEKKIFRNSLVRNFGEFFETFKERNCFGDEELERLVEEARKVISGVEAEDLRQDEGLKQTIARGMGKIGEELVAIAKPGRKLDLS